MTTLLEMTSEELESAYCRGDVKGAKEELLARLRELQAAKRLIEAWATLGNGDPSRAAVAIVAQKLLDEMRKARK
jgi:hypothetical protein